MSLKPDRQFQVQIRELKVQRERLAADQYEITMDLQLEGRAGEDTLFVLELVYAGVFVALNVPESSLDPFLLIECPRLLFPFARRIVADATRDGGFPPLLLDPIDFVGLYRRRQQQAEAEAQSDRGGRRYRTRSSATAPPSERAPQPASAARRRGTGRPTPSAGSTSSTASTARNRARALGAANCCSITRSTSASSGSQ